MDATGRHKGVLFKRDGTDPSLRNDDAREETLLENLLIGVQRVTQTAFYIGCGAAMFAWEALEKLFQTMYGAGSRTLLAVKKDEKKRDRPGKPRKVTVPMLPIDGYDRLEVGQVLERLAGLSERELRLIRRYEEANRNREEVLREIDRRLAGNR